jgi:hypothetical protein
MARGRKVDKETKKRVQKGVSETKKAWDFARQVSSQPMGPGQSMAMAGNTGLAGFSENQANEIKQAQQAIQNYNQSQGDGSDEPPVSFKQIGQQIGELGSKYRRPVGFDQYANKAMLFNQGIAGGGKIVVGPDGIPRLQFGDQVVRDPNTGQQMLSMMLPELTASAPTLGQLGGDISRAFTGYDSLKYPDQNFQGPFPVDESSNLPYMQRTPGMFEGINPLSLIPGVGTAMKIGEGIQGLYDYFTKPPVVTYGGDSNITVREEPIQTAPQFPYNFETTIKPKPDPLLPSEMSQEQFMESYPELYSGNPLFRQQTFEPIRVSDMDMSGVVASERGQNIIGKLQNLQNLANQYNLNKIQFDPFNPNQIGYKDQFMFNNTPVNYNLSIGDRGLQGGIEFAFKKGGSVDKHSGLGYKLK